MYRICYLLYCFIGLLIFLAFSGFLFFVVPMLDQFDWIPDIIRRTIAAGNDFIALGEAQSKLPTIPDAWLRTAALVVFVFIAVVILVNNKKAWQVKALKEREAACIPLTSLEKLRCKHLLEGATIIWKTNENAIQASVYGHEITLSQGALDRCSDVELTGLIAHELGHIKANDSLFCEWALNARWYYAFFFSIIRSIVHLFWGIGSRCLFVFGGTILLIKWGNTTGNTLLACTILAALLLTGMLFEWIGKKVYGVHLTYWAEKIEKPLRKITLAAIKILFYDLTFGWLLLIGNDLAECEADRHAIAQGYAAALQQALLRTQQDEFTSLKRRSAVLLKRRIHKAG